MAPTASRERRFTNPLFVHETPLDEQRKTLFELAALGLVASALMCVVLFSSLVFGVQEVVVDGNERIQTGALQDVINHALTSSRLLGVIPRQNLLLVPEQGIINALNQSFALASVRLERRWPKALAVYLVEASPDLVVTDTSGARYFVTQEGTVADPVASDADVSSYPTLTLPLNANLAPRVSLLTKEYVRGVSQLVELLQAQSLAFQELELVPNTCLPTGETPEAVEPNDATASSLKSDVATNQSVQREPVACPLESQLHNASDIRVGLEEGYALIVTVARDLGTQMEKYARFKATSAAGDVQEYVDVRVADRLYYR